MKFLCLCHYESARFAELKPADFEEIGAICAPHDAALKASGKVEMVGALGMPEQSRTLRVEGGAVTDTAGPFKQMPEPFGAFFIVEAADIDEAVAVEVLLQRGSGARRAHGEAHLDVSPVRPVRPGAMKVQRGRIVTCNDRPNIRNSDCGRQAALAGRHAA